MKNVILVVNNGVSLAYGKDVHISGTSSTGDNIVASLKALNSLMETIPTEYCETYNIYIPELLKGISSGFAIEYVKSGKQLNGEPIAQEIVDEYKKFYTLYGARILNVKFSLASFIAKMRTGKEEMTALKSKAYAELNKIAGASTGGYSNAPTTQTIDPDAELRKIFDEQIKVALSQGNMELYMTLKAERDKLKQPEIVTISGQQATPVSFEPSDFDNEVIDSGTENNNDTPQSFEKSNGITPNWEESIGTN